MSKQKYRRRQYLLDAPFQLGLGARVLGWALLYVLGFLALTMLPVLWHGFFEPDELAMAEVLLARLSGFAEFNFLALVFVLAVLTLHVVRFTHRLAGPAYRFKLVLRDMAAGIYRKELRLRDGDFYEDVAEEFTLTLGQMRARNLRQRKTNDETQIAARKLLTAASDVNADPERLILLAHEVLASAESLGRQLPYVETEEAEHSPATGSEASADRDERSDVPETVDLSADAPDDAIAGAVTS